MTLRHLALIVVAAGCTGRSTAVLADRERITNPPLTGAWDLTLTLERPYQLGFSDPPARRVCGTIGFVDAASGDRDVERESDGVYHVALARLGLNWLDDARFPAAIARQHESADRGSQSSDSVTIMLNPDSKEHIVLLGVYHGSEVDGYWSAQSARGTASGIFTLRQHVSGRSNGNC